MIKIKQIEKIKRAGIAAALAAVLAVTALSGCGNKAASAPAQEPAGQSTGAGGQGAGTDAAGASGQGAGTDAAGAGGQGADQTSGAGQAQLEAPGKKAEFQILTGTVTAVTDTFSEVTLQAGDTPLTFPIQQADIETSYELAPDTQITLIYKGVIEGSDTSKAKAVMVVDVQEGMAVREAVGQVTEQAMSAFTIRTEDGKEMSFLKNNCEGLSEGVLGQAQDDSNGSGVTVKVTYVSVQYENASLMNFPLKVEGV